MDAKKPDEAQFIEEMKERLRPFLPPECLDFKSLTGSDLVKARNEKTFGKMSEAEIFLFSACANLFQRRSRLQGSAPLDEREMVELEKTKDNLKNLAGSIMNLLFSIISARSGIDPENIKICKGWEIVSEELGQNGHQDRIETAAENSLETFKGLGIAQEVSFGGKTFSSF